MPSRDATRPESAGVADSLLSRALVAPLLFVSFLISLFIIDRRNYGAIFASAGNTEGYYHTHQRKLAKQQVDDAFRLRQRVIVAILVMSAVSMAVLAWALQAIWVVWRLHRSPSTLSGGVGP